MSYDNNILIPSSIQRIRCFMNEDGGLRLKPWAGVDETLDEFFTLLHQCSNNDYFWKKLLNLTTKMSEDVNERLKNKGQVLDNEVLNTSQYDNLLSEIRIVASKEILHTQGSFKRAMSGLSVPAVSLMLLLGGAMTAGCSNVDALDTPNKDSAIIGDDTDTNFDSESDFITDSTSNNNVSTSTDNGIDSETTKAADTDTGPPKPLMEIIQDVELDLETKEKVLTCVEALNESWKTGLEELFQGENDSYIIWRLNNLLRNDLCDNPEEAGEFSLDELIDNSVIGIYLGVFFE